ncbi:YceD family protein [Microaerobacter geothermalis]|uniref:YceD family protein n=1 Tax=Microaerobacter geothermalis TaxID=674972 RepID=UPI001F15CE38|nr:YceD family protein [Microaerobacter geothermalis]MCF6095039.1 YceD family protein [Microaerobacter geothermalis]
MITVSQLLQLKGKPLSIKEEFDLSGLAKSNKEIISISPVFFEGESGVQADIIMIKGTVSGQAELSCSRCLTPFTFLFHLPFSESFHQGIRGDWDDEVEVHQLKDDRIELSPYIEEKIILSLPFIPICKEECLGLCPQCGKNKNLESCECKMEKIDPRWAGLAALFSNEKEVK